MNGKGGAESDVRLSRLLDFLRRTAIHYGLWFAETQHMLGLDRAIEAERLAGDRFLQITRRRLERLFPEGEIDAFLESLNDERLEALQDAAAANWLAADGVWFQAIESLSDMGDAKRINDTCWSRFSPYEAARIRELVELPQDPLAALETVLANRIYARLNVQETHREDDGSLLFVMRKCRVQSARRRKGLDDYPCKSGGLVEYTTLARAVDPRLETSCVSCPPDEPAAGLDCAWRFRLAGSREPEEG